MHTLDLILILLAVVTGLVALSERTTIPYPIFLVLGGLALALLPGVPSVQIEPDVVFRLFLPPILFSAAYFTSWRDFRANIRPISQLAVGCVLFTTVAVALVAHTTVSGLSWASAFVLGAIVAPPDAIAATAIFGRLGVPRRLVTILEGESLVNDASALVAYRFAVIAVVTGSFSLLAASGRFVVMAAGGIAIGIIAGWLINRIIPNLGRPPVVIMATLLAPVSIYVLAEQVEVSGVLATVVAGLVHGRGGPVVLDPEMRISGETIWNFVIFLSNALVFILIGLQLRDVGANLEGQSTTGLAGAAVALVVTVILVRLIWIFASTYLPYALRAPAARGPAPSWRTPLVASWAGLRGVVSLAAALALPLTTEHGTPFPNRDLIILMTYVVILATLVGQGLTLGPLVRRLGIASGDEVEREETYARRMAAQAALSRLDAIAAEPWVPEELAVKLRARYIHVLEQLPESLDPAEVDTAHVATHDRLRREVSQAQREAILDLRARGEIGDDALHRIERDLDLDELRSEV